MEGENINKTGYRTDRQLPLRGDHAGRGRSELSFLMFKQNDHFAISLSS